MTLPIQPAEPTTKPEAIRAFVREFFAAFGGDIVEDRPKRLRVRLGEELKEHFAADELAMAFRAQDAGDGQELVTHGSYVMDMIHSVLQDHGWKSFVTLPTQHKLSAADTAKRVSPHHAEIGSFRRRRRRRHDAHFQIKVSYQSDEKIEEILSVQVDDAGRAALGLSPAQIADMEAVPTERDFLSKAKLLERFRTAIEHAERHARRRAADAQKGIFERLYKNVTRIKGYYERQIDDASRRRNGEEEAAALEVEMRMKLREQRENHYLRVVLKLLSVCVVQRPVVELSATVSRDGLSAGYTMTFDESDGSVALPACPECGKAMARPTLCDAGHLVCADCVATCSQCGAAKCGQCGVATCPVCGEVVCTDCAPRCDACKEHVCARHLAACCACSREVCPACAGVCAACGETACRDHLRECSVCGKDVCENCQASCSVCHKAFCRTHADACAVCGQVTCSDCMRKCETCGANVCASHHAACAVCGAAGCRRHFRECAVSHMVLCKSHGARCMGCGEWTSDAYLIECRSCGERYCAACLGDEQYCRGCLALILDWPDAEYATQEQVEALVGHAPSAAGLRHWRVYSTGRRHLFMANSNGGRELIVADEDMNVLRRRRLGYPPRRQEDVPF